MIDDLLDTSRLQAGRLELRPTVVVLKDLLEDALHKAIPNLQQGGHEVVADITLGDTQVLADADRIEQVLHNILENAARHSPRDSRIEVGATVRDGLAIVNVRDYGDGILRDEMERIFEPFYRGENSRRLGHGTGLGLSICRGIVDAHGGEMWVESQRGEGSSFYFALSVAAPRYAEDAEPSVDQGSQEREAS